MTSSDVWTLEQGSLNYEEHRQLPIKLVEGITKSEDNDSHEVVLHVLEDCDDRFNCVTAAHKANFVQVIESIL